MQNFLPLEIKLFLQKLGRKILAILILSGAAYLMLSLLTHSNNLTTLLIYTGEKKSAMNNISSQLFTILGIQAFFIPIVLYRIGHHIWHDFEAIFKTERTFAFISGICLLSMTLSAIPVSTFPTTAGLGGIIGINFLYGLATFGKILHIPYLEFIIAMIALPLGTIGIIFGLNLTKESFEKCEYALQKLIYYIKKKLFIKKVTKPVPTRSIQRTHQPQQAQRMPAPQPQRTTTPIPTNGKSKILSSLTPEKQAGEAAVKNIKMEKVFKLPPLSLLQNPRPSRITQANAMQMQQQTAHMLINFMEEFGVKGRITNAHKGPVITLYEFEPIAGTKTSKITSLAEDIARSMSLDALRIATLPGTNVIGLELPNMNRETVYFKSLIENEQFKNLTYRLPIALGSDIGGDPVYVPLEKMPHLLVAGRTGAGKSVFIRAVILSLLYRLTPEECRFILIDPKMLEFADWNDIPHLLTPVVTDPAAAVNTLKWAVREMEERYRNMSLMRVKNIEGYNEKIKTAKENGKRLKKKVKKGIDPTTGHVIYGEEDIEMKTMPYIVIIVDELADLMIVAGKEVEASIQRLAQMARAAGIHLILATQRPSVNVITGVIKANFPTRISFQTTSKIDSRTILEQMGAEQLLDKGDMLYLNAGKKPVRVQAPFATEKESQDVADYLKTQGKPDFVRNVTEEKTDQKPSVLDMANSGSDKGKSDNELYDQAVEIVQKYNRASISFVQRQLRIGYNRAANLIEEMEENGVVSSPNTAGKRDVLGKND